MLSYLNLAHKVINNANLLNLFTVNNFNCADIDFINQPIQNCLVQLCDGRMFSNFSDEPAHIAVCAAGDTQFVHDRLHPCLVVRRSCSSVSVMRRNRCSVRIPFALPAYRLMNISSISWLHFARVFCSFFKLRSSMEYRCSNRWVSRSSNASASCKAILPCFIMSDSTRLYRSRAAILF